MIKKLLLPSDKSRSSCFILALSGGPDSVALLRMILDEGYNVEAAHCNFHLRGAESDRDEAFCKNLCEKLGVKLHLVHFDTKEFAQLRGISIEMAARELRYRWFTQLAQDTGAEGVCIAHHSDDQVETILLNMLRGTGLKGLLGMKRKNGIFLRPLLGVSRNEILQYLDAIGQDYVTDSTNLEDDAQRNKLRLDVIPLLEKVTPAAKQNILRMADNLGDVAEVVKQSLEDARQRCAMATRSGKAYSLKMIRSYASPRLLLWSLVSGHGFNREQATEMLSSTEGGRIWTSQQTVAVISNNTLFFYARAAWEAPAYPAHSRRRALQLPQWQFSRYNRRGNPSTAFQRAQYRHFGRRYSHVSAYLKNCSDRRPLRSFRHERVEARQRLLKRQKG